MKSLKLNSKLLMVSTIMLFTLAACNRDEEEEEVAPANDVSADDIYVNNWVHEQMKTWYLWNDNLPASPNKNQEPEAFFESLLYKNEDRFSWIQDNYQELINSLNGITKEAGYEFALYRENETSNSVIAQILYIKPNSPAASAGLKRGDLITHINDQQITTENYQALLDAIEENHSLKFRPYNLTSETFGEAQSVSLTTLQYTENPNYLHTVIDANGRKVGYYVYNFFAEGPNDNSETYDVEMESIFQDFKAQGITDLVLDLRFNSGGSEGSANLLASLIGNNVNSSKVFLRREYNDFITNEIRRDPDLGEEFLTSNFQTKANNIGSLLSGGRVYILTSSRTASASELIINSLKPYMDVFIIGNTTYGKNVGSISLYEENDPRNRWGIQPIVVKVYNSADQSDYTNGFTPNIVDRDNRLVIYPLGDTREALLSHAIGEITGEGSSGRRRTGEEKEMVGHSLDGKRRSFELLMNGVNLKKN